MKIWSDTLNQSDMAHAASLAHVWITDGMSPASVRKARKRAYGWTIALSGDSPYMQGTANREPGTKAATWDQWGIFLNALFEADPNMTTQYYTDAAQFHAITTDRFTDLTFADAHRVHHWKSEPYTYGQPIVSHCDCGATVRRMMPSAVAA